MSSTAIIAPLSRGASGLGSFPVAVQDDLKVAYKTVGTYTDLLNLPAWARTAYMTVFVIGDNKEYTLGSDETIAGQVWTVKDYGVPTGVVTDSELFDTNGFIKPQYIQNIFLNSNFVIGSQAAMLALTSYVGNFMIRTDTGQVYIKLNNTNPASISDFALATTSASVLSVNGQTGIVNITIANLLADSTNLTNFNTAVSNNSIVLGHSSSISTLSSNISTLNTNYGNLNTYVQTHLGTQLIDTSITSPGPTQDGYVIKWNNGLNTYTLAADTGGGGGGATIFTALTDVPSSYSGQATKLLRVKSDESGLEFFTFAANLAGLTDVTLSSLTDGQFLQYRTSDSKWHNSTFSGDITVGNTGVTTVAWSNGYTTYDARYLKLAGGTLTGALILAADPVTSLGAATKNYVDNLITGLTWKQAVQLATTANITLSGEQTIDGILTSSSRILVKNQTTQTQNGIYTTSSGAWVRTNDADIGTELLGSTVYVESGTINAGTQWSNNNTSITIGSTNIAFVQIAGVGTYTNGAGLSLTGNVFSISSGGVTDAMIASSTNWNTAYTNRITSLTTTGSSGAATLGSNVLNIPNYTISGLGGWATSGTTTVNSPTINAGSTIINITANNLAISGSQTISAGLSVTGNISSSATISGVTLNINQGLSTFTRSLIAFSKNISNSGAVIHTGTMYNHAANSLSTSFISNRTASPGYPSAFTITGGSGYTNGTYNGSFTMTGGTGSGAVASQIIVSGGAVTSVTLSSTSGASAYTVGDVLTTSNTNIGGTGTGFSITVTAIDFANAFSSMVGDIANIVDSRSKNNYTTIYANPTYNITSGQVGSISALWYDPVVTAIGSFNDYFLINTRATALSGFGTSSPSATLDIRGNGSTNPALRIASGGTSTEYAFRVQQSDVTTDIFTIRGNGTTLQSGSVIATANNFSFSTTTASLTSRSVASDTIIGQQLNSTMSIMSTGINGIAFDLNATYSQIGGVITLVLSNNAGLGMTPGTYTNVTATSTSGSGSGALFTVIVATATTISSITATTPGTNYKVQDTVSFNGSLFGGSGSVAYLVGTVTGVSVNATALKIQLNGVNGNGQPASWVDFYYNGSLNGSIKTASGSSTKPIYFYDSSGVNFQYDAGGAVFSKNVQFITTSSFSGAITANSTLSMGGGVLSNTYLVGNGAPGAILSSGSWSIANTANYSVSRFKAVMSSGSLSVGGVNGISLTTGGSGYTTGIKSTTGGTGTGATVNITGVSSGVITSVVTSSPGSGYSVGDVLTIVGGTGGTVTVTSIDYGWYVSAFEDVNSITDAKSNNNYIGFYSHPTYNITSTQTGATWFGYYNPSYSGSNSFVKGGIAIVPVDAVNGFGTGTPNSTVHVNGSFAEGYIAKATNYTLTGLDCVIEVTATGQTITLPTAVGISGRTYTVKLTASGSCTVATTSAQTIDGASTYSLSAQWKYVILQSNGANWLVVGNN